MGSSWLLAPTTVYPGMKKVSVILFLALVAGSAWAQKGKEVQFTTKDNITVYGDLYLQAESSNLIILFHQAGSCAKGEYETIIPVLTQNGYSVLAIDQRSGGSKLGGSNRTVEKLQGKTYDYCDTYPDFEAALNYVKEDLKFAGKVIAWGSSYSAALVIHLMSDYPDKVSAVLAFSPASGGPMKPCSPNDRLADLSGKALILRPAREMQVPSVQEQFSMAKNAGLKTYIANNGVHGSSMLNDDRVEGSTADTWNTVLSFLNSI